MRAPLPPCEDRYASLYFVCSIDVFHNELDALESIQLYVETLDRYFGNVRPALAGARLSTS